MNLLERTITSKELEQYLSAINGKLIHSQEILFKWEITSNGDYQLTISKEAIFDLIALMNKN